MPTFANDMHTGHKVPLVETDDILKGAVTTEKISDGAITTDKIADQAITTEKIGDGEVKTSDIADGAVTTPKIADEAVTTEKIDNGAVTTTKIANASVTNDKLGAEAVTNEKVANGAVTNEKVANGTLSGEKFQNGSISGEKILDNSVPGSKLADGSIESVDIKDNTLEGSKLVDNTINGSKIKDNQIESRHLQDNSIPGEKIKDGTIENVDIKDGTLDGAKIKDNTIQSGKLADGAVSESKIVNGAVTEAKLGAGAVTENKIGSGAVTSGKIGAGAVTTDKIADEAVTEDKLAPGAVTTEKLADGVISEIENITDAVPTANSVKPVQSGGVFDEIASAGVYDVSAKNSGTTFASLSALLNDADIDTLIPTAVRKGGMTIRFVQTSDNKYVQYMYKGTSTSAADFTNVDNWQKMNLEEEISQLGQEIGDFKSETIEVTAGIALDESNSSVEINIPAGEFSYIISGDESLLVNGYLFAKTFDGYTIGVITYPDYVNNESQGSRMNKVLTFTTEKALTKIFLVFTSGQVVGTGNVSLAVGYGVLEQSEMSKIGLNKTINRCNDIDKRIDNLYNPLSYSDFTVDGYITPSNGGVVGQSGYKCTDFKEIIQQPITSRGLSYGSIYVSAIAFYDFNKNYLGGYAGIRDGDSHDSDVITFGSDSYPIPKTAVYARYSCRATTLISQILYVIPYNFAEIVSFAAKNNAKLNSRPKFIYGEKNSLTAGQTISFGTPETQSGTILTFRCKITSFDAITLQHGNDGYQTGKVKIDGTNVYVYGTQSDPSVITSTIPHGLTISEYLSVKIEVVRTDGNSTAFKAIVSISTLNGDYKSDMISWFGCGSVAIATSNGSSLTDCKFAFTCKDWNKNVWVFGDSYLSFWVKDAIKMGFDNALFDGHPGATANMAFASLTKDILYGRPKTIVWALGMNNEENGAMNANWLARANELTAICDYLDIELVFVTIPNTSKPMNNTYKNAWIKESGYRYVDVAEAVDGENLNSTWYSGYLGSDQVHPSDAGAKAIAERFAVDVPELADLFINATN